MPQGAPPNGSAPGPVPEGSWSRVAGMQAKLHRWAAADPGRRFDDLFNFVCRARPSRESQVSAVFAVPVLVVIKLGPGAARWSGRPIRAWEPARGNGPGAPARRQTFPPGE